MKWKNNLLEECTEKELYELWLSNKKMLNNITFDQYVNSAIKSGCKITDRFIIVEG